MKQEQILVDEALCELRKIHRAVGAILEAAGEDMGYTSDMLEPIDSACGAATQALLALKEKNT